MNEKLGLVSCGLALQSRWDSGQAAAGVGVSQSMW